MAGYPSQQFGGIGTDVISWGVACLMVVGVVCALRLALQGCHQCGNCEPGTLVVVYFFFSLTGGTQANFIAASLVDI